MPVETIMTSHARTRNLEDPLEISYGIEDGSNSGKNKSSCGSRCEVFTFNDADIEERTALERPALTSERRKTARMIPSLVQTKNSNSVVSPMYTNLTQKSKDTNEIVPNTPRTILTLEEEEDSFIRHNNNYNYNYTPRSNETPATTLSIEHNINREGGGNVTKYQNARRFIKPILAIVAVLTTGSAAYFFSDFLEVPGLKSQVTLLKEQNDRLNQQIDELKEQVSRLTNEVDKLGIEVDRLEDESDRLENINDVLNKTALYYSEQNLILNGSLDDYQQLNSQLMNSTELLEEEVLILGKKLNDINVLNIQLNQTVWDLTVEVDNVYTINQNLNQTNVQLNIAVTEFSKETEILFATNSELNVTVENLEFQVEISGEQIDRLQNLTTNLGKVVSFLNETSLNGETMDDFVQSVADSITTSRVLAMDSFKNLYRQKTSNWDCDFREYFISEPFVEDRKTPISSSYSEVLEYIDWKIFSTMCLDTVDYELFLQDELSQQDTSSLSDVVTFDQITQSVGEYTDRAFDYFFLPSQNSINPLIWDEARYDCKNLLPSQQYRYRYSD